MFGGFCRTEGSGSLTGLSDAAIASGVQRLRKQRRVFSATRDRGRPLALGERELHSRNR